MYLGVAYAQNSQFNKAEPILEEVLSYSRNVGFESIGSPTAAFLGAIFVAKGDMSNGFKRMEAMRKRWLEIDRRACLPTIEYVIGSIYFQIIEGAAPVSFQTVIKNIGFLIKNVPFAAKKAEYHFNKALELAKEIGADGIMAQSYHRLGLLHRLKKRNDEAKDCFQKAIEIFEELEAEEFLRQSNEALGSLG